VCLKIKQDGEGGWDKEGKDRKKNIYIGKHI
jgi:hypothetical protein